MTSHYRARDDDDHWLTLSIIEDLKGKGHSQSAIARMTGYTRQYISWIVHTYGGKLTKQQRLLREHFPFKVPAELQKCAQYKNLRLHGKYVATESIGFTDKELKRLRAFYRKLRDEGVVLEYDPSIPPTPGVCKTGGWAYRERQPEDGNLLIRVNEFTHLTTQGRTIWRLPLVDP